MEILKRFIREEDGAAAAEYALILAVVVIVAAAAFIALGSNINTKVGAAATAVGT